MGTSVTGNARRAESSMRMKGLCTRPDAQTSTVLVPEEYRLGLWSEGWIHASTTFRVPKYLTAAQIIIRSHCSYTYGGNALHRERVDEKTNAYVRASNSDQVGSRKPPTEANWRCGKTRSIRLCDVMMLYRCHTKKLAMDNKQPLCCSR